MTEFTPIIRKAGEVIRIRGLELYSRRIVGRNYDARAENCFIEKLY